MFEMADTGPHHFHFVCIAILERKMVVDRSSGLYYRGDAGFVCNFHAVGEREIGVRSHDGALQVETEALRFFNGLFQRVYARSLSYAVGAKLLVLDQRDGV